MCHQPNGDGEEDCLTINIYSPKTAIENNEKLPVMFWIYGGAYVEGYNKISTYNPEYFIDTSDVVIVAVNYRLGPLGFLKLPNSTVSGNIGLMDQLLGLQWVNENIKYFGGNMKSVTLFGESAGGLSVNLHTLSPLSNGLFQRAIIQSGTVYDPDWHQIQPENAIEYSIMLAEKLGCYADDMEVVLGCLQTKPVDEIMSNAQLVEGYLWMPTIDDQNFIPDDPFEILENGSFNKDIEIIIGNTADEGLLSLLEQLADPSTWGDFQEFFNENAPRFLFNLPYTSEFTEKDQYNADEIVKHYIGSYDNMNEDHLEKVIEMFSDDVIYGSYRTAKSFASHGVKVYQYILSYVGQYSTTIPWAGVEPMGVNHGDDLLYLWKIPEYNVTLSGEDVDVKDTMTRAWVDFAVYGNPTPESSGLNWTPLETGDTFKSVFWNVFGPEPEMEDNPYFQDKLEFWESLLS